MGHNSQRLTVLTGGSGALIVVVIAWSGARKTHAIC
jgi:hypothetical protein